MEEIEKTIKEAIRERYGTEAAFARHIGWSKQRMNRVMHKERSLMISDVPIFSEALGIPMEKLIIFFAA